MDSQGQIVSQARMTVARNFHVSMVELVVTPLPLQFVTAFLDSMAADVKSTSMTVNATHAKMEFVLML